MLGSNVPTSPWAIFDQNSLPQLVAQAITQPTRNDITHGTCHIGNNDANLLVGPRLWRLGVGI
jgi:hypothetical protein